MATTLRPAPSMPEPLWMVMVAPAIWMSHFLACAITAALGCGRWSPGAAIGGPHAAIALYTVGAVLGITLCLAIGQQARRDVAPHARAAHDAAERRQQWLPAATLVLAWLSLLGAVFVAVSTWMGPACA